MEPTTFEKQFANRRPMQGLSVKVILSLLVIGLIMLAFSTQASSENEQVNPQQKSFKTSFQIDHNYTLLG